MQGQRNTISRLAGLLCASALALVAASTAAHAADKYVLEEVEETRVEFGTGWYIRGDIGIAVGGDHIGSTETTGTIDRTDDISTTFAFRGGFGMKLVPNIRADLTLDYHSRGETAFEGLHPGGCAGYRGQPVVDNDGNAVTDANDNIIYVDGDPITIPCTSRDSDTFSSQDFMLTGYYDFKPIGHFTPYVGVGVGATRLDYSSRQGDIVCEPPTESTRCIGGTWGQDGTYTGTIDEGTSYHLAGSLSLGISYQLTRNLTVDASYQLTKTMEEPLWGGSNGYEVVDADSLRHAARIGLRYELW